MTSTRQKSRFCMVLLVSKDLATHGPLAKTAVEHLSWALGIFFRPQIGRQFEADLNQKRHLVLVFSCFFLKLLGPFSDWWYKKMSINKIPRAAGGTLAVSMPRRDFPPQRVEFRQSQHATMTMAVLSGATNPPKNPPAMDDSLSLSGCFQK